MDAAEDRISSVPRASIRAEVIICRRHGLSAERPHSFSIYLRERGLSVAEIADGLLPPFTPKVLLILNNANWYPTILTQLKAMPKPERPFVMIWHTEPLPPPKGSGLRRPSLHLREIAKIVLRDRRATDVYTNFWRLKGLHRNGLPDLLAVSTQARQEFLDFHDIPAYWVPMGYSPADHGFPLGLHRDIDVLYLGTRDVPRRRRLLRRLESTGTHIHKKGSWVDPDCWGEKRNELISRAKIFLNLQRYAGDLSGLRMILGMANRALVVSEPVYRPAPYVPGKHYISVSIDEMHEAIHHYLERDEERERITGEAYKFISQNVTSESSARQILELLCKHSALTL
jgi:hypothetical protein